MKTAWERCPGCFARDDDKNRPVPDNGPCQSHIAFYAECPGKFESNTLTPFVGASGQELDNTYLPIAGLQREDVRVGNMVHCKWADGGDPPPEHVVKSCAEFHLKRELLANRPEFVVLMGGVANSLLGWDVELHHGMMEEATLFGHRAKFMSTYHPALGLHMGARMQDLLGDFRALKRYLAGADGTVKDEHPNPAFYRTKTASDVASSIELCHALIAIDTESRKTWKGYKPTIRYIPYSIQYAVSEDEAFIIYVEDREAVLEFGRRVKGFRRVLEHNAPHDQRILARLGVMPDWDRVTDTMSMAYCRQDLPKGLKPLSTRLLGSKMAPFDDIVRPYGIKAAVEYLDRASEMDWPEPEPVGTGVMAERKCKECKGKGKVGEGRGKKRKELPCVACEGVGMESVEKISRKRGIGYKINLAISSYVKKEDFDPWERWYGWESDVQQLIDRLGPMPLESVELVPVGKFEKYAGTDAVNTWRIYKPLVRLLAGVRKMYTR